MLYHLGADPLVTTIKDLFTGWLDVLDNANGSIGGLLIEDIQKLGTTHSTLIVVLIPKPDPLYEENSKSKTQSSSLFASQIHA